MKIFFTILLLILLAFPLIAKSQIKTSIGLETTSANSNLNYHNSYGFGISSIIEYTFTLKFGLAAQIGYIHLLPNSYYKSANMIPLQAIMKFYFNYNDQGAYMTPMLGIHKHKYTTKEYTIIGQTTPSKTTSITNRSFGFGIGYLTTSKFDFYFRINWVDSGKYLGLRLAREF
ncbi:MAG: hypothetical protein COB15_15610 [Flavobacteriales bacterium]|nr:MAG: hypothetical protein COB15_15610 [Flavobacteriales bacterium]